jgi:N-acetyltransferase
MVAISEVACVAFDLQPSLRGELVELRPLREEDWEALFAAASDPLIWAQHPARDRWREDQFRIYFREALEERGKGGGAFVVLDATTGGVIGSTRFHGYNAQRSEVEIGWTFLARAYWGGKYNAEMKRLLLEHALQLVERVVFYVGAENGRSQKAMERIGAQRERLVEKDSHGGGRLTHVRFDIDREGFERGPLK